MIHLTINDQKIEVEEGTTILEAVKALGINIPTLCYHKALSPYGACRLCIVEISAGKEPWIATSCLYPAQDGLVVKTHSERVLRNRRVILELLLARCPESQQIQELAKELGVTKTRLKPKNEDCTLCGLCVRMCRERMGIGVMSFVNRGSRRKIIPPFDTLSDICQTCGACASICPTGRIKIEKISRNKPIPILSEFDEGLKKRSPIYISYPQAVPNWAAIDKDYCVHMLKDKCGICQEICEAGAIDYEQKEEKIELSVGSIILAPGFDKFDPKLKHEYGYKRYRNVVTSLEFERILSASGPFQGHLQRLSDGKEPKKIAWIQCVGSRDCQVDNQYCSSVCCTYAIKEAIIAKEHSKNGLEATIFYMDIRTYGKGFEEYYNRAKDEYGVKFVKGRVFSIKEIKDTHNLILRYTGESGNILEEEFDLVVLSIGLRPNDQMKALAKKLGIRLNPFGFARTHEFSPVETTRPGVFVAGALQGPKDIPETVMQASGAAARAAGLIAEARGSLITKGEYPPEIDVTDQEPRIGVFVCHCGINIGGVVDVPSVVSYVKTLPNVIYAENNLYTCSEDTQKKIIQMIKEYNLNRVVVASCSPRTHEPLFQETIRQAGLNKYLFEMANIRDQCSWVHMEDKEAATLKAKDLVRSAVAKARLLQPLQEIEVEVKDKALVIGGGLSGMLSSLSLATQGFGVSLIERDTELGGNLKYIYHSLNGGDPQEFLKSLIKQVEENEKISVYKNAQVKEVTGFIGNFKTTIELRTLNSELRTLEHGVIIVATGAEEYKPTEYLYGQDPRVITQRQFEERLWRMGNGEGKETYPSTVVMIQCVGSRDKNHPYCSRICCQQAIKNALKLKEIYPETNVYILYKDMRTYGFGEVFYEKARSLGVVFLRYTDDLPPHVGRENGYLQVSVYDPILDKRLMIVADMVILSAGVLPADNQELAKLLKVPLNQDGFFLEAHVKLRPVDFATDGIYLAGLCHSPKTISESISQALAAASKASIPLSQGKISVKPITPVIDEEKCIGCGLCVALCQANAMELVLKEGGRKSQNIAASCKGCGLCGASCPQQAVTIQHFTNDQIISQIEALAGVA